MRGGCSFERRKRCENGVVGGVLLTVCGCNFFGGSVEDEKLLSLILSFIPTL